jgi:hypothetical protein
VIQKSLVSANLKPSFSCALSRKKNIKMIDPKTMHVRIKKHPVFNSLAVVEFLFQWWSIKIYNSFFHGG